MPIVDLKSNLKNNKFGKDRPDGGSSNQPYIEKPLNLDLPPALDFLGNDFLLRGGPVGAPLATANDVARLTKYFTDVKTPSGLLFAAKQNLLSRTAVKTQTSGLINEGIYTPLSTLAQAGVSAFGLHLNKQGLNPFTETGAYATNNENLYAVKIQEEKLDFINGAPDYIVQNRLYGLYATKIVNIDNPTSPFYLKNSISLDPLNLLTYSGGPGSDLGIGKTNIKFADQRTGINNFNTPAGIYTINSPNPGTALVETDYSLFKKSENSKILINGNKLLGLSNIYLNLNSPQFSGFNDNGDVDALYRDIGQLASLDTVASQSRVWEGHGISDYYITNQAYFAYTQKDLNSIEYSSKIPTQREIRDFRTLLRKNLDEYQQTFEQSVGNVPGIGDVLNIPDYTTKNIENRVNLGDPGNRNQKNLDSYTSGSSDAFGAASYQSYDKINESVIYKSSGLDGITDFQGEKNDLVKFAISVIDTNQKLTRHIHFRAFLDQISDKYTADWDSTQYIGRGEKFYTYKAFDRQISLSWTVAAQSKIELIPMYKKLNYLASICAPNYNAGYMGGNIARLTVGGYLYQQLGIITGFSYEMNDENATWEIGIPDNDATSPFYDSSVKELPHLIKVTGFNFIPIHEFVPRLVREPNSDTTERFIALANGFGLGSTNYKA
jgi:hypothetical protein